MQVLRYLLVQNSLLSSTSLQLKKRLKKVTLFHKSYLYIGLLKELYEKNTQAPFSKINVKWLLSFVHGTDTQVWLENSGIPLDWG